MVLQCSCGTCLMVELITASAHVQRQKLACQRREARYLDEFRECLRVKQYTPRERK